MSADLDLRGRSFSALDQQPKHAVGPAHPVVDTGAGGRLIAQHKSAPIIFSSPSMTLPNLVGQHSNTRPSSGPLTSTSTHPGHLKRCTPLRDVVSLRLFSFKSHSSSPTRKADHGRSVYNCLGEPSCGAAASCPSGTAPHLPHQRIGSVLRAQIRPHQA